MTPADPSDERFQDPGASPRYPSGTTPRNSTAAVVALVLALVGLCFPLLGVVAVIVGIVALGEINRSGGEVGGGGLAWIGIVLGALETLGTIALVLVIGLGAAVGMKAGRGVAAATLLEQVAIGQRNMQATAYIDADGDGIGEFGSFADLDSTADLGTQDLNDPTVQKMMGYRLRLELPETTDEREVAWWAFQEPLDADGSLPWLYIDESSILRVSSTVSGAPSREDAQQWEVTTSQRLAESMAQDMFGGN